MFDKIETIIKILGMEVERSQWLNEIVSTASETVKLTIVTCHKRNK